MTLNHFKIIRPLTTSLILSIIVVLLAGCSTLVTQEQEQNSTPQQMSEDTTDKTVTEIVKPQNDIHAPDKQPKTAHILEEHATQPKPQQVWDVMRKGFKLQNITDNQAKKRIQKEIDWYLSHPNYIKTVNSRSVPYISHIVSEVAARQLPHEIALLPFVESGFDPQAYSYANASGLWQFMPKTGKSLGLQQDWWKDDRRDIVLSTDAALTYLAMLNKRFKGNWLHALAAYNSGAGNVSKAIRKNKRRGKPTSYWHLDLPKETAHYVPKLLAITHIYNHPEKYGVNLQPITYTPYFEPVEIDSQLDLNTAAQLADISIDEFMMINPSFNQFATHPEDTASLLLPVDKVASFNEKLAQLPKTQRVTWHRYKIRSGDSLSVIARKHKVSMAVIKKTNQLTSNTIRAGKTLLIPSGAFNMAHLPNKSPNVKTNNKVKKRYIVKSGDSLWKIARAHNIKINHITRWNNLSSKKPIQPGQKLTLWISKA